MKNCLLIFLCSIAIAANAQNNSLSFNGTNYVSIPTTGALNLTGDYTIEAWIKPSSFVAYAGIVSKFHTVGTNGVDFRLSPTGNSRGLLINSLTTVDNILTANVWQHVAAVKSGGTYTAYVNGIAYAVTGTPYTEGASPDNMTIGVDYLTSPRYFSGQMDEVRVWNVARTPVQLKANMFKSIATNTAGLVAYYNFNEGSGSTLGNSCTNTTGINGSLVSNPSWVASPVQLSGNALNFDGTNDYVVIGNAIATNASYTKEAWIYMTSSPTYGNVISSTNSPFYFSGTTLTGGQAGAFGIVNASGFALNTWTHIALTFDAVSNSMVLYKNGAVVSTSSGAIGSYATENITIGAHEASAGSWTSNFPGSIDEVRIWNKARTQTEIQQTMNNELDPSTQTNLVAYYTFNQGVAAGTNSGMSTVIDRAGNFNGTMNNFALTGVGSNFVTQNVNLTLLPLQWLSFTAVKQQNSVLLQWSTAAEQNTKDFTVQRSTDGLSWSNIGTVNASGNNNQTANYYFTDAAPLTGINYYRVLQTDADGRGAYSITKKVIVDKQDVSIIVMGNPVKNDLLRIIVNEAQLVSLLSADGKLCWQNQLSAGTQQIDVSSLRAGIYILKSATTAVKIVISR